MDLCKDYEDLFKILNSYKIKYLVVGAYAVIFYTEPRYTKDVDIWVISESNESKKIYKALKQFGAPLHNISADDFHNKKIIYQIGVAPVRIDILTHLPGMDFSAAWKNRKRVKYGKTSINIIGKAELIKSKTISKRPQDKLDIIKLKRKTKTTV